MLKRLTVRQFAIIDDITVNFQPGMTVLTGETGAGKSLLIDAILLLLGDRASADMIRSGFDKAELHAWFDALNERALGELRKLRIAVDDGVVHLEREITTANKNPIRINGVACTLGQLKDVARHLADVHSQFDTQRLIQPIHYLPLIDGFQTDRIDRAKQTYLTALEQYRADRKAHADLLEEKRSLKEKEAMLQYQLQELDRLKLDVHEKATLTSETKWMQNFDKVHRDLQEIRRLFEEHQILDQLYEIRSLFDRLGGNMEEFASYKDRVGEHYYDLDDIREQVNQTIDRLDYDPDKLDRMIDRLEEIRKVEAKYGQPIEELIATQEKLRTMLSRAEDYDQIIAEANAAMLSSHAATVKAAGGLSSLRQEVAKRIELELAKVFQALALDKTRFSIVFDSLLNPNPLVDSFQSDGVDAIDFWISTNPGEPLKPLSKTVSGGEMSRVMLAFKTIFIQSQQLSTIVFDEIDTGISGQIAKRIAKQIKRLSMECQVISISHLPHVVGAADVHLKVRKNVIQNRTIASVKELAFDERIAELAEMISGDPKNESGQSAARELLLSDDNAN
jgi:DNA repair protein RecN (Recombination protein N)